MQTKGRGKQNRNNILLHDNKTYSKWLLCQVYRELSYPMTKCIEEFTYPKDQIEGKENDSDDFSARTVATPHFCGLNVELKK